MQTFIARMPLLTATSAFGLFIYLFNITDKGPEGHTAISLWLTQKEPVKYTNKLIKKTTNTNYREYLQLTKNLILANITMNDKRGQERKNGV